MDLTSKCTCRKNFIDLWYTVFFKIQSQIFSKILHFCSKDLLFFYQDRVYFDTGFQNFFPISIFTKVQNFTMVQKPNSLYFDAGFENLFFMSIFNWLQNITKVPEARSQKEEEEKEKIPHMWESIGHRPVWGRCPAPLSTSSTTYSGRARELWIIWRFCDYW